MWDTERKKVIDYKFGQYITDFEIVRVYDDVVVYADGFDPNRFGLIDLTSKNCKADVLTDPIFHGIPQFINGRAIVTTDNGYGYIDSKGNMIKNYCQSILRSLYNDNIVFRENDLWGIMDTNGNELMPPTYSNLYFLRYNYMIKVDSRSGVIDKYGNIILDCNYNEIEAMTKDLYKVRKRKKYGLVNSKNEIILPMKYSIIDQINPNRYFVLKNSKTIFIIDEKGNTIKRITDNIGGIKILNNNLLIYNNRKGKTVLNSDGEIILSVEGPNKPYDYIIDDDIIYYHDSKSEYFLNDKGEKILETIPDDKTDDLYSIETFIHHNPYFEKFPTGLLCLGNTRSCLSLYDLNGNQIKVNNSSEPFFDNTYEHIEVLNDNLIKVINRGRTAVIDRTGKIIIPFTDNYSTLTLDNGLIKVITEDQYGNKVYMLYDLDGNILIDQIADVDSLQVINSNQVIINNYIFNLDNIKYQYQLKLFDDNHLIKKTFADMDEFNTYIESFIESIIPMINQQKQKRLEMIEQIDKKTNEDIDNIIENVDEEIKKYQKRR